MKIKKVLKAQSVFLVLLSICCGLVSGQQMLTKKELTNLNFAKGFTGTGKFAPVAVLLPKNQQSENSVPNTAYLAIKKLNGWQKLQFDCLRGIGLSNDGKIWVINSRMIEGLCIYEYRMSYSSDGGMTWIESADGYNPSIAGGGRLVNLSIDNQGKGILLISDQFSGYEEDNQFILRISGNKELHSLLMITNNPDYDRASVQINPNIVEVFKGKFTDESDGEPLVQRLQQLARKKTPRRTVIE